MKRRTFLKGMGISLALPVLDAMVPSMAKAATAGAPRFAGIFLPTGIYGHGYDPTKGWTGPDNEPGIQGRDRYFPAASTGEWGGTAWRPRKAGPFVDPLPPILGLMEQYKQHLTVISGLSAPPIEHGGNLLWLSGLKTVVGLDYSELRNSIDQEIANRYNYIPGSTIVFAPYQGGDPSFREISFNTKLGGSVRCPRTTDPRAKFNELFGSCNPTVNAQLTAQQSNSKSVLDFVADSIASLQKRLGSADKVRMDSYLTNVRELERKLASTPMGGTTCPTMPTAEPNVSSGPLVHVMVENMMVDVMALAMASDAMPICTLMLDIEANQSTDYAARVAYNSDFIGARGNRVAFPTPTWDWHDGVSHHINNIDRIEMLIALLRYELNFFKRLIQRLSSMPAEPNGFTPLDNSILMSGPGMSDGHLHINTNLPVFMAGGRKFGLTKGHLALPMNTPFGNLHYSLLKGMGVPNVTEFNGNNTMINGLFV